MSGREEESQMHLEHVDPPMARPAHLAPRGPTPRFELVVKLYEECLKSKLEARRQYLFKWFDVRP